MAKLGTCRACGGSIGGGADNCPHCGHPTPAKITMDIIRGVAGLAMIFVVAYFLMSLGMFGGLPD